MPLVPISHLFAIKSNKSHYWTLACQVTLTICEKKPNIPLKKLLSSSAQCCCGCVLQQTGSLLCGSYDIIPEKKKVNTPI